MNKYERGTTDSSMPQDLIKIKSQEHIPKYIIPYEKSGLYWRDLESKSVNDKAGASEESVMSQKLNILGFTSLMI